MYIYLRALPCRTISSFFFRLNSYNKDTIEEAITVYGKSTDRFSQGRIREGAAVRLTSAWSIERPLFVFRLVFRKRDIFFGACCRMLPYSLHITRVVNDCLYDGYKLWEIHVRLRWNCARNATDSIERIERRTCIRI